ncbi:MAG: hypothetical protein AAB719_01680 [Patescibacteria group bacterium]
MKKYWKKFSALFFVLVIVFTTSGFIAPQTTLAQAPPPCSVDPQPGCIPDQPSGASSEGLCPEVFDFGCEIMSWVVIPLAESILQFMGFLTGLAGVVLNAVVYFTVISMSDNYAANETAINNAWDAVRDLANMGFIFILLYAAIRTILGVGSDTKKLIVNVIIVAILINFSLFFTKLVIDAANILALFFHDLIIPSGTLTDLTTALSSRGLSNAFMQQLNLQSLYSFSGGTLGNGTILTITMMGSIMLVISAFVFFSMAIMLIVRYVVLILVLILSPIAFIAFVLPALRGAADKWKETLVGQAFFAPIFFMILWIAVEVLRGIRTSLGSAGGAVTEFGALAAVGERGQEIVALSSGAFAMFMNFMIVIVFLLAALSIAKSWANKAGSNVTNATKFLTGAVVGTAAFAGRQTVGRAATAVSESEYFKGKAAEGSRSARLALWAGRKGGSASYDARNAPGGLGGVLDADSKVFKGTKDGFSGYRKAQSEKAAKVAESYAPSDKARAKAKAEYDNAKTKFGETSPQALQAKQKLDNLLGNKEEIKKKRQEAETNKQADIKKKEEKNKEQLRATEAKEKASSDAISKLEGELETADFGVKTEKLKELDIEREKLKTLKKETIRAREKIEEDTKIISAAYDKQIESLKEIQPAAEIRKGKYADMVERSPWAKLAGYNYAAAARIRTGKSKKDKLIEAYKDVAKESGDLPEEETPEATPPSTPPPPSGGTTSTP